MTSKFSIAAVALLTVVASPSFAQMAAGNSMMASDGMKMSKADTMMMAKCKKMTPAKMQKNAKCTKMMEMHPGM